MSTLRKQFTSFFLKLTLLTSCLVVIAVAVKFLFSELTYPHSMPIIFGVFYAVTLSVHYILLKAGEKRDRVFVNYFMMITFVKLMIWLALIVIAAVSEKEHAAVIVVTAGTLYILFTFLDVTTVLRYLRRAQSGR